jgi:hypothetical protein
MNWVFGPEKRVCLTVGSGLYHLPILKMLKMLKMLNLER